MSIRGVNDIKDIMLEKVPPQNLEAEIAVLGSMLIEEEAIGHVVEIANASHFYKDAHKKIFQSIIDLYNLNKAVDLVTLTEALQKKGGLDEVGGAAYLTELTAAVPTAANVGHYARIVKEKAILRNLINTATHIISQSYDGQQDAGQLLDKAEKLIFDIAGSQLQGVSVSIKEIIKDSLKLVTAIPLGVYLNSGSRVRLPIKNTRFKLAIVPPISTFCLF